MPALIHFGRKWLIACDDLAIPYAIEFVLRVIWLCAAFVMLWIDISSSISSSFTSYFLYGFISHLLFTSCLCIGISFISSRGSVLQVQKRAYLSPLLCVKCFTVFCDLVIACYLIWLLVYGPNLSFQWKIFYEAASACLYLYVFGVIIAYFICYNSLGSSIYWNKNHSSDSIQILKKAEHIWHLRLKFFCCCADVSDDDDDFIYTEIATFFAAFSSDIEFAPTDILAGLIAVSNKHATEKRKMNSLLFPKLEDVLLILYSAYKTFLLLYEISLILFFLCSSEDTPRPFWMTAENAVYYLKIAKSTYGWMAFYSTFRPWQLCLLMSPSKCFTSCLCQDNTIGDGDFCYCNSVALEKISGLPHSDIIYASFSNSIYEPAFVIAIDHSKKSIIIAVRGTRSFSDLISSIDGEEVNFPIEISSQKLMCHRGVLRSSLFIYRKIQELNILKIAFAENHFYTLVLTGHSLGGSIVSILSLLLLPEYPSLQCYSYSPLPVLSSEGISKTFDIVFSVVAGDDMVPRLTTYSCKELFRQLYKCLEETELPKYKILSKTFWYYIRRKCKFSHKPVLRSQIYENRHAGIEDFSPPEVEINMMPNKNRFYAPGRILYLKRDQGCEYSWVTGFHFQNIIITPHIIKDHQPHQVQHLLEKYKSAEEISDTNGIFSIRL